MDLRVELSNSIKQHLELAAGKLAGKSGHSSGGLLVGSTKLINDTTVIRASAFIEADTSHNFLEEIKYSSGLWKQMYQKKNQEFPGEQIIGWFLVSPGLECPGPEEFDIHSRFFNDDNKVLITSTAQHPISSFISQHGCMNPCKIWVSEEVLTEQVVFEPQDDDEEILSTGTKIITVPVALKKLFIFSTIFAVCLLLIMYKDLTKPILSTSLQASNGMSGENIASQPVVEAKQEVSQSSDPISKSLTLTTTTVTTPPPKENNRKYVVKKGDSLWTISEKYYGTGFLFYKIMKQNEVINPNTLYVGQVLVLPEE